MSGLHLPLTRRHMLFALCFSAGLAGLSVGIIRPILVDIADTFAISVALAGQLMTGAALAGLMGNLALAPVVDRIDRRTAIISALVVMLASSLGCAVAPSFGALAVAYALAGLSGITLLALVIASAGDLYGGPRRARSLGWIMFGNVVVSLIALPILSALAGSLGWRVVFYGFAGLAAVAAMIARGLLPGNLIAEQVERLGYLATLRAIGQNRVAVALLITIAGYHASIYGFSTFAGAVAVERFGATIAQTGLVLTARLLGMAVTGVLMGRFARASDWRIGAGFGIAGALLGLAGYAAVRSLWAYGAVMLLHGAAIGAADLAVVGLLLEAEPDRRGSATALRSVMEGVGGIVGPASGGAVIANSGYGTAGWLFTLMSVLSAGTVALAARWTRDSSVGGAGQAVGTVPTAPRQDS